MGEALKCGKKIGFGLTWTLCHARGNDLQGSRLEVMALRENIFSHQKVLKINQQ